VTTILLNNLDQLPRDASLCMVGSKGRNSRLAEVLHSLRPDLNIRCTVDMSSLISGGPVISGISAGRRSAPQLPPADYLLLTTYKTREHRHLSAVAANWSKQILVVNPNFYHPFRVTGEDRGMHAAELRRAQKLLHSAEDRSIYDLLLLALEVRDDLTEVYLKLLQVSGRMGQQYFDFIDPRPVQTIIEGGIADGWTSVQLLQQFPKATVYGFDPDSETLENSFYSRFLSQVGRFHYNSSSLWDESDRPSAAGKTLTCSRTAGAGDAPVSCAESVSIDRFVASTDIERVDFIKLDIEGAELHVVQGAQQTISSHRPQMAVCIYHRLDHYYRIPFLLNECCTDYIFRAGHYSPFHAFSETVWSAIPKEHFCDDFRSVKMKT
jgi:FkbM family methyltransferase